MGIDIVSIIEVAPKFVSKSSAIQPVVVPASKSLVVINFFPILQRPVRILLPFPTGALPPQPINPTDIQNHIDHVATQFHALHIHRTRIRRNVQLTRHIEQIRLLHRTRAHQDIQQMLQRGQLWNQPLHHPTERLKHGMIVNARQMIRNRNGIVRQPRIGQLVRHLLHDVPPAVVLGLVAEEKLPVDLVDEDFHGDGGIGADGPRDGVGEGLEDVIVGFVLGVEDEDEGGGLGEDLVVVGGGVGGGRLHGVVVASSVDGGVDARALARACGRTSAEAVAPSAGAVLVLIAREIPNGEATERSVVHHRPLQHLGGL
mmetsp:Transcript_19058/g.40043  ORF Transcript_19058/g.40043 Transcript_19058/m.40043 type:complete len:315 (+) Transcript_19058:196-1140(+)